MMPSDPNGMNGASSNGPVPGPNGYGLNGHLPVHGAANGSAGAANGVLVPAGMRFPNGMVPPPASLTAQPNAFRLLKALQRCWLPATVVGALVGGLAAFAVYYFLPMTKSMARATLRVHAQPPSIIGLLPESRGDNTSFQRSQIGIIKHNVILTGVLRNPQVADLPIVREQENQLDWLSKNLQVDFNIAPDIMTISMVGDDPQQLSIIVETVRDKYAQYVNEQSTQQREKQRKAMSDILAKEKDNLNEKLNNLKKLKDTNDHGLSPQQLGAGQLYLMELINLVKSDVIRAKNDLNRVELEIKVLRAQEEAFVRLEGLMEAFQNLPYMENLGSMLAQYQVPEATLEFEVRKHPRVADAQRLAERYKLEMDDAKVNGAGGENGPAFKKAKSQYEEAIAQLESRRQEARADLAGSLKDSLRVNFKNKLASLTERADLLRNLIVNLDEQLKAMTQQAQDLRKLHFDVAPYQEEIDRIKKLTETLALNLQRLEIEIKSEPPQQVQLMDSADEKGRVAAMVSQTRDIKKVSMLSGGAGAAMLFLVMFAFAYREFRIRRVNAVEEVVEGLGLRLMGTLPDMSRTQRLGGLQGQHWQNLLTESVDATRTMLLHDAAQEKLKVVMVTSAVGGEGKTSLSSHLAASLARAGRKTLLIDCDLRRPAVHRLFDLPLSPGLSEVLREEATVEESMLETPVAGLTVLSAGRCDLSTLAALAHDRMTVVLDQLRERFDFIIVDSAPVLPVADSLLIGQHVDAVLFSILQSVSKLPTVYAAYQKLSMLGIKMLGAVVNGARGGIYGYGSYYRDAYGYGYGYGNVPASSSPQA